MLLGGRGERSFRQSLDLTILYSDLQIFRLNKNIKCIPQNAIIKKKNNRYCKNVEHLLFCYSLNKFTNLNCRFLQLFTPRICGLSSLSRKKKLFFTEVRDLTTIFWNLFCTFGLFCWPYREAFTAPTANKIEAPSTRIRIFFTPDSFGRGLNGLLLKAVLNRSGFGERIHCNNKTPPVESILRSRGLEKKKRKLLSHETRSVNGRKTKQEHEQLLWNT